MKKSYEVNQFHCNPGQSAHDVASENGYTLRDLKRVVDHSVDDDCVAVVTVRPGEALQMFARTEK